MDDNYPTDEELEQVEKWPYQDLAGLLRFVYGLWWAADWGWRQEGRTFYISTGGWSGNESLISALHENHMFWTLCWQSSRRGGHYVFEVPESLVKDMPVIC